MYSPSVEQLIKELAKLPGIGEKTAERLTFHMLLNQDDTLKLAHAAREMVEKITNCEICYNFAETTPCSICSDESRDSTVICVVEEPKDVLAIERSGSFKGLYHVLLGKFAPLDKKDPEDLTISGLLERLDESEVKEVILATNPTMEGDGTALYLANHLKKREVKVSRIGRGVSWGLNLNYANKASLADALASRRQFNPSE